MSDAREFKVGTKFYLKGFDEDVWWWVVVEQNPTMVRTQGKAQPRRIYNPDFYEDAIIISEPVSKDEHVKTLKEKYGV